MPSGRRLMVKQATGIETPYIRYNFDNVGNIGEQTGTSIYNDMVVTSGVVNSVAGQVGTAAQGMPGLLETSGIQPAIFNTDVTVVVWANPINNSQRFFSWHKFGVGTTMDMLKSVSSNGYVQFRATTGAGVIAGFTGINAGSGWFFLAARYIHVTKEVNIFAPTSNEVHVSRFLPSLLSMREITQPRTTAGVDTTNAVDEARLWTRYLSDQELVDIYDAEK